MAVKFSTVKSSLPALFCTNTENTQRCSPTIPKKRTQKSEQNENLLVQTAKKQDCNGFVL